jgi:hypothetical protein
MGCDEILQVPVLERIDQVKLVTHEKRLGFAGRYPGCQHGVLQVGVQRASYPGIVGSDNIRVGRSFVIYVRDVLAFTEWYEAHHRQSRPRCNGLELRGSNGLGGNANRHACLLSS